MMDLSTMRSPFERDAAHVAQVPVASIQAASSQQTRCVAGTRTGQPHLTCTQPQRCFGSANKTAAMSVLMHLFVTTITWQERLPMRTHLLQHTFVLDGQPMQRNAAPPQLHSVRLCSNVLVLSIGDCDSWLLLPLLPPAQPTRSSGCSSAARPQHSRERPLALSVHDCCL